MPNTVQVKFNLLEYLSYPKMYTGLLKDLDDKNQSIIGFLDSDLAKHNLSLGIAQKALTQALIDLFAQLTGLSPQYITYPEAWNHIISQIKPLEVTGIALKDQLTASKNTYKLLTQETQVKPQYYTFHTPNIARAQNHKLIAEMQAREQFRTAVKTLCRDKPYTKTIDFTGLISPQCIALATDIIQMYSQDKATYPIYEKGTTNIDFEETNNHLARLKLRVTTLLQRSNIDPETIKKIMSIWSKTVLRHYMVSASQRLLFARSLRPKLSVEELSGLITQMNNDACKPEHIIGDEMAAPFISEEAVKMTAVHERIMEYLQPTNMSFFSEFQTISEKKPEQHPIFSPLFKSIEHSITQLTDDFPESFNLDRNDPNYKFLHFLHAQTDVQSTKEGYTKDSLKTIAIDTLTQGLQNHIIPQLIQYRTQWDTEAKKYQERTKENYDFAYQLVFYTATNTSRIALDARTRENLYGSDGCHFLYRPTSNSSIPLYLQEWLHKALKDVENDTHRAKLEAAILRVHRLTDYIMLSKAGRDNTVGLGLFPPLQEAMGQFFPDDPDGSHYTDRFSRNTPFDAKLAALSEHHWRKMTAQAIYNFSVIPTENSPINFKHGPRAVGAIILGKFLTKSSIAVPVHISPGNEYHTNSSFHDLSVKLSQKAFFKARGPNFYRALIEAYKAEAKALVNNAFEKLDAKDKNWFSFLFNTFPAEVVLDACRELKAIHTKLHLKIPVYARETISPKVTELWRKLVSLHPIIHVLMSPSTSSFAFSRDSTKYWTNTEEHQEFYRTIQGVINRVRVRMSKFLDLDTGILLPLNILVPAGLKHFGNRNAGLISAICSPIATYVTGELSKQPFSPSIEPTPTVQNLLRILFHSPEILFKNRIYQGTHSQIYKFYITRIKDPAASFFTRSNSPAYLSIRVIHEMGKLDYVFSEHVDPTTLFRLGLPTQGAPIKSLSPSDTEDSEQLAILSKLFSFVASLQPTSLSKPKVELTSKLLEELLTAQKPLDLSKAIDPFNPTGDEKHQQPVSFEFEYQPREPNVY